MADLALVPRGTDWTLNATGTAATPVVLPADLALGDYVVAVASVDYPSGSTATEPGGPSCPAVASWSLVAEQADQIIMSTRAWIGRVTSAPQSAADRTVTVTQTGTSGLHLAARGFYGGSGDAVITVEGAAGIVDRNSPYVHATTTPAGSKDLLVVAHAAVQFSGTLAYGAAPAGMTGWAYYFNQYSGLQVCTEQLTSAAASGTRSQTSTPTNLTGGAGLRFLLRSQGTVGPTTHQGAAALAGSDILAVGARQTMGVAAALAGQDTLAVAAARVQPAAAGLSAQSTLTVGAARTAQVAAPLTAVAQLDVSAGQAGQALLTSADTLTVGAPQQQHASAVALAGQDTLTVAARQTHQAGAALTSADQLAVAAARDQPIAAALTAADSLAVTGTRVKIGAAALSAQDTLAVGYVLRTAVVAAALLSTNTLIARATASAAGALNPTVWAVDPATGRLKPLPHVVKLQVDDVTNDVGAITLDYPVFGKNFSLLSGNVTDERKLEVEVWLEGSRATRVVGRLDQRQGDDVTEGAVWSFSGTLITGRLDEGVVAPQPLVGETTLGPDVEVTKASVTSAQWSRFYALGYRTTDEANTKLTAPQKVVDAVKANAVAIPQLADPKREAKFSAATPGAILLFLLQQCWGRGALTDLTVDFTATKDSAGVAWPEVLTAKWSPVTTTLLQVAQRLVELGLVEFTVTPDRVLRVWRFGGRGTNRTSDARPVTLRRGQNLLEAGRRQGSRGAGSRFFVVGGEGAYTQVEDLNAQARLGGVVEVGSSIGNITEQGALSAAAQRTAAAGARGQDERTFALALGVGMPRPGKDLGVCDTVRVDTAGQLGTGRVAQWTVALDAGSQMPAAQVTTGDLIRSRQAALLKRLQDQQSGETVIGTSQPSEDRGVPAAPTGLVVDSAAYLEGQDVYASVTAGWASVQVNTDGTATTDLDRYRVEWRLESRPTDWQLGAEVDAQRTTASWVVGPATPIRVRVQAIDRSGNRSTWSADVAHVTEDDATPPSVPSTPVGADWLGTTRWTWDGNTSSGADMRTAHPDFSHVELHMSTASNFTPDVRAWPTGTLLTNLYAGGTWTVADLPYGTTQFCRLVAVDIRNNRSAPSAQAQATPDKLVQIDVGPNAIGRAQIIDGEIVNAKIDNLAVNDAKVSNLSVGKLTAGVMSADVIVAGIFRTALTGSRAEFDNAGIRLYDSTGAIRVNLASATGNALITGEYRTAMSGSRIVWNPLGSSPAESRWYPTDGVRYSRIKPATSVAEGFEGQGGIIMKAYSGISGGLSGEVSVFPSFAALAYGNEMDGGAVQSRVSATSGNVFLGGPKLDMSFAPGGQAYIGCSQNNAYYPRHVLRVANKDGDAAGNVAVGNFDRHSYLQFDTAIVSVVNDSVLINIQANAFVAGSERRTKTDIETLPWPALDVIRAADTYRYRKVGELHPGQPNPWQLGLMVDQLPDDLLVHNVDEDWWGVDVYGALAVSWGAHRETDARVAALEREVAALRARLDRPALEVAA